MTMYHITSVVLVCIPSHSLTVDSIFSELSEEPLGAASLAQCHKGILRKNGEIVAVKVQHPDVQTNGYTDMDTIDVSCVWLITIGR